MLMPIFFSYMNLEQSQTLRISERLKIVHERISRAAERSGRGGEDVTLVAVAKTRTPSDIEEAIRSGIQVIGENRVQEAEMKNRAVSLPVNWHLVGHLQTNKVKKAVEIFDLIHSLDSLSLAKEIDRRADLAGKVVKVLVQVNTSDETSKFGVAPEKVLDLIGSVSGFKSVRIVGLMTIGAIGTVGDVARPFFVRLRESRDRVVAGGIPHVSMNHLSMGMTGDFEAAVEEGATLVRIGTAIFGERA